MFCLLFADWFEGPSGNCFKLYTGQKVSWEHAQAICRSDGGFGLAALENEKEISFITGYLTYKCKSIWAFTIISSLCRCKCFEESGCNQLVLGLNYWLNTTQWGQRHVIYCMSGQSFVRLNIDDKGGLQSRGVVGNCHCNSKDNSAITLY